MDRFKGHQWPVTAVLALVLGVELISFGVPSIRELVVWLMTVPTAFAAVLAFRHRVTATVLGAGSVVVTSVAIQLTDTYTSTVLSPLTVAETAAYMVIVALVVQHEEPRTATTVVVVLAAVTLHAALSRPGVYWLNETDMVGALVLGVLAVGTGLYFRARDAERTRQLGAAVSDAQKEERIALARELHDVVAHHVTGMLVQAQAALEVSDDDPKAAHRLLPGIVRSGTEALGAMRRLVGTLRQGETDDATTDLTADLLATVERTRELGLTVKLRIDLPPDLPAELGRSVLRLVQESLTNVHQHAKDPTLIEVELFRTHRVLRVAVTDDGRGGPVQAGGYGLVGMRERVDLLGGSFRAGPREHGWQVLAELPVGGVK